MHTELVAFVEQYRAENGYSPTYAEIGEALNLHPSTVRRVVKQLERSGALVSTPGKRRTLRTNMKGRSWPI